MPLLKRRRSTPDQLRKAILEFLVEFFNSKDALFVRKKVYLDTYISYHYLAFIKLYHSLSFDNNTLELCSLHLKVLLAFAYYKNEDITMKFYQLKTLDFLVREVNLEYEITQVKQRSPAAGKTLQASERHPSSSLNPKS